MLLDLADQLDEPQRCAGPRRCRALVGLRRRERLPGADRRAGRGWWRRESRRRLCPDGPGGQGLGPPRRVLFVTFESPTGGGGRGGRAVVADNPPRRSRTLVTTLVVLGVLVLGFALFTGFYTDLLWYQSVDASSVFTTQLVTRILLLLVFGVADGARRRRQHGDRLPAPPGLPADVAGAGEPRALPHGARPAASAPGDRHPVAHRPARRRQRDVGVAHLAAVAQRDARSARPTRRSAWTCRSTPSRCRSCASCSASSSPRSCSRFIAAVVVHYIYGGIRLQPADDRLSRAAQAHLVDAHRHLRAAQGGGATGSTASSSRCRPTTSSPGVDLQGRQRGPPGPDDPGLRLDHLRGAVLRQRVPRAGAPSRSRASCCSSAAALVIGSIYPAFVQSVQVQADRARHARRRTSSTTSTPRARPTTSPTSPRSRSTPAKDIATDRRDQGQRGHDRERAPARPGGRVADVQAAAADPRLLLVPRLARRRPLPDRGQAARHRRSRRARSTSPASATASATGPTTTSSTPTASASWRRTTTPRTPGKPAFFESNLPPTGLLDVAQPRDLLRRELAGVLDRRRHPPDSPPRELDYPTTRAQRPGEQHLHRLGRRRRSARSFNRLLFAVKYQEPNILLSDLVNPESRIL